MSLGSNQTSPRLSLPLIAAGQAQKHITHNEALIMLDALVHLSVIESDQTAPPSNPALADRYLIAPDATGIWANFTGQIASWNGAAWDYLAPRNGWQLWDQAAQQLLVFDGVSWQSLKLRQADQFGVSATPDAVNKFVVSSPASLLNHDGAGHQLKINKASAVETASLLFQTAYSGRAEMGLAGDDDFHIKTSADGTNWHDVLLAKRTTGEISFPNGLLDSATGLRPMMLLPAVVKDIWRSDMDAPAMPRFYTVASVSGNEVTLTTHEVEQFYNVNMRDASMIRIWNMSKTPVQAAWVNWNLSSNQFRVFDAASVASWSAGDQLRLGDPNPTGSNALQFAALDISNYLFNHFGKVFPQRGLKFALASQGIGGRASLTCSGNGAVGTAFSVSSASDGGRLSGFVDIFTTVQSPISNSNLLFVREDLPGGTALAATRLLRLSGIWV